MNGAIPHAFVVDIWRRVSYLGTTMNCHHFARRLGKSIPSALALVLITALAGRAAVVAEGTYTISAPERRAIPFRMVITPTGARITPSQGETMIFSYEKKSALIVDNVSHSYFLLPLELFPPLLASGLGYDPRSLGSTATGTTRMFLGTSCAEVIVSGRTPRFTLRSWRVTDPAWSRDYARLEGALGLPWATAAPPLALVGLPLAGSIDIEGARPYHATWEITKLAHDASLGENFAVPPGYLMDLGRLLSVQGKRQ